MNTRSGKAPKVLLVMKPVDGGRAIIGLVWGWPDVLCVKIS